MPAHAMIDWNHHGCVASNRPVPMLEFGGNRRIHLRRSSSKLTPILKVGMPS
jgi:hypothetical protein